jgi:hypothetical protein
MNLSTANNLLHETTNKNYLGLKLTEEGLFFQITSRIGEEFC